MREITVSEISYAKRYRQANREKIIQQIRDWRKNNKEHVSEYKKGVYRKLKEDAVRYYSGGTMSCTCCGITEIIFLGVSFGTKSMPYSSMAAKKYPEGGVVYCANCLHSIRLLGECVHKKIKKGF